MIPKHDQQIPPESPAAPEAEQSAEGRAVELRDAVVQTRGDRISMEDAYLRTSVEQRRINLLDYVRRGRLAQEVEIMPQIIDTFPKILQQDPPLLDLNTEPYNFEAVRADVVQVCQELEADIIATDGVFRDVLSRYGLAASERVYIDEARFQSVMEAVQRYKDSLDPTRLAKVRAADPELSMRTGAARSLSNLGIIEMTQEEAMVFLENPTIVGSFLSESPEISVREEHPIKQFIVDDVTVPKGKKARYNPERNGFTRFPRLEDYDGEIVEPGDINLDKQRLRNHLGVIKRGEIPPLTGELQGGRKIEGATIIDGNIGYTPEGEIRDVEGLIIIDHHDQLETQYDGRRSDTATSMIIRILSGKLGEAGWGRGDSNAEKKSDAWRKGIVSFVDEYGASGGQSDSGRDIRRLSVYVNHLDTDSVLSAWAYRRPNKAMKHTEIALKASQCGDFLLGSKVMEYGVTARDYEYIIRGYLKACMAERVGKKQAEYDEKIRQADEDIVRLIGDRGIDPSDLVAGIKSAIGAVEANDPVISDLNERIRTAPSSERRSIGAEIQQARKNNSELKELQRVGSEIERIKKVKDSLMKDRERVRADETDNTVILNHMLDIMEDIITNPFKYQRFLLSEREIEEETIEAVNREYHEGVREIRPDVKDTDILVIEPTNEQGRLTSPGSYDGLYFALRKREDWNKRIIITRENGTFLVAINTQNAKHLEAYDFNALIDTIKPLEQTAIESGIAELSGRGPLNGPDKKKMNELQRAANDNREGKLWRNRTQMIFCMQTYIPGEQVMEVIRKWKKNMAQSGGDSVSK